jgi:hypothetical protein
MTRITAVGIDMPFRPASARFLLFKKQRTVFEVEIV